MAEDRRKPSRPRLPPDMDLWRRVASDVKPIKRDRIGGASVPEPEPSPVLAPKAAPANARRQKLPTALPLPKAAPRPAKPALSHGFLADLDRRTAQRLQRGRLPIEATLDLHGMTQAAAHEALNGFIGRSEALGRRCVLVVTGKGRGGEETGVLRRQVPHWLNQAPLRGRVLAFDFARPEHGGMGALYVLLKRRREKA